MKIGGGFILLSKKIVESEIFKKPPLYLKVWIYLLAKANHSDGTGLKRGQVHVTYKEIQDACSYYEGYRKITPTKKQVFGIFAWLRNPCGGNDGGNDNGTMVETTKATRGMVVTIDKYSFYQDSKNYGGNNESGNGIHTEGARRERQGNRIVKEVKEERSKEENNRVSKDTLRSTDVEQVVNSWNKLSEFGIAPVQRLGTNTQRYKMLVARLREYGFDKVLEAVVNVSHSDFLQGKAGSKPFVIDFEWFVKPNNFPKVLEGKYKNKKAGSDKSDLDRLKALMEEE